MRMSECVITTEDGTGIIFYGNTEEAAMEKARVFVEMLKSGRYTVTVRGDGREVELGGSDG